jgi:hypothetical protein
LAKIDVITKKPSAQDLREYITWVLTQERSNNPVTDPTGEGAGRNQGRHSVWFIPGGIDNKNKVTRECTVPSNREILILAATADSSYLEHRVAQRDDQLLAIAKEVAKLHENIEITIGHDGVGTKKTFRKNDLELIETPAFPITIPEDNIYKTLYGVRGGDTSLAAVAWGIKVKLEPGEYTLILKAQHEARSITVPGLPKPLDAPSFNLDIEYKLTAS